MATAAGAAPTVSRDERIGVAALTTAGFGVAAVAGRDVFGLHVVCPLRALAGLPCPGCGMTSVASSLAHGDVAGAVGADPAGVLFVVVVALLAVAFVSHRVPGRAGAWPSDRTLAGVAAVALAVHWATTAVTGGMLAG